MLKEHSIENREKQFEKKQKGCFNTALGQKRFPTRYGGWKTL